MPFVQGFPPVASAASRVLILGSMPGTASLAAQQYYAHPRNAFWPIVGNLLGFAPDLPYRERLRALRSSGVALWDVLQCCDRDGSLDSDIAPASRRLNDFAAFFARHRRIVAVLCNGGTAHGLFVRRVLPTLGSDAEWHVHQLPSTSPAHAARSLAQKRHAWRSALLPHLA